MSGTPLDIDPQPTRKVSFWAAQAPYVIMLLLVFTGMVLTSLTPGFSAIYWQITAVAFAGVCIVSEWGAQVYRSDKIGMAIRQGAHWLIIVIAMRTLFYHDVMSAMTPMALGLAVLGLLAIGTLLAGVHLASWQIGLVGVLLALAIPGVFWLERISLLLTAAAVTIACIAGVYFWQKRKSTRGDFGQY